MTIDPPTELVELCCTGEIGDFPECPDVHFVVEGNWNRSSVGVVI